MVSKVHQALLSNQRKPKNKQKIKEVQLIKKLNLANFFGNSLNFPSLNFGEGVCFQIISNCLYMTASLNTI